jgi:hypothetical protein
MYAVAKLAEHFSRAYSMGTVESGVLDVWVLSHPIVDSPLLPNAARR